MYSSPQRARLPLHHAHHMNESSPPPRPLIPRATRSVDKPARDQPDPELVTDTTPAAANNEKLTAGSIIMTSGDSVDYAANSLPRLDLLPTLAAWLNYVSDQKGIQTSPNNSGNKVTAITIQPTNSADVESVDASPSTRLFHCMNHPGLQVGASTAHPSTLGLVFNWPHFQPRTVFLCRMILDTFGFVFPAYTLMTSIFINTIIAPSELSDFADFAMSYSIGFPIVVLFHLSFRVRRMRTLMFLYYRLTDHGHFMVFKERNWQHFMKSYYTWFFILSSFFCVYTGWSAADGKLSGFFDFGQVIIIQLLVLLAFYYKIFAIDGQTVSLGELISRNPEHSRSLFEGAVFVSEEQVKNDLFAMRWIRDQFFEAMDNIDLLDTHNRTDIMSRLYKHLNLFSDAKQIGCYNFPGMERWDKIEKAERTKESTILTLDPSLLTKPVEDWTDIDWMPIINAIEQQLASFEYKQVSPLHWKLPFKRFDWAIRQHWKLAKDREFIKLFDWFIKIILVICTLVALIAIYRLYKLQQQLGNK